MIKTLGLCDYLQFIVIVPAEGRDWGLTDSIFVIKSRASTLTLLNKLS